MQDRDWINDLFIAIDARNIERFCSYLSEDCHFRFGNLPAVKGSDATRSFVSTFFDSIDSLKHELSDVWFMDGEAICHGTVCYTRHDKSNLIVPFANVFKIKQDKIFEYLIFADTSDLYNP